MSANPRPPVRRSPSRAQIFAALVIVALLAAAGGALFARGDDSGSAKRGNSESRKVKLFKPDHTAVADCDLDRKCLRQAFGNLGYEQGATEAASRLAELVAREPSLRRACHGFGHRIGEGAMTRDRSRFSAWLDKDDGACRDAVAHGLLNYAFVDVTTATAEDVVLEVCEVLETRRKDPAACGHPIGGGLMKSTGGDVDWSLGVCSTFEDERAAGQCDAGVYRAHFADEREDRIAAREHPDDPYVPCSNADAEHARQCFMHVPYRFMRTEDAWDARFTLCAGAPDEHVANCFRQLARQLAGEKSATPASVASTCAATAHPEACFGTAASRFVDNDLNTIRAVDLCGRAPAQLQTACLTELAPPMRVLLTPAEIGRECARPENADAARQWDVCA